SMSSLGLRRGKDGHTATDGLTKSGQEPKHRHLICRATPQALLSAVPSAQPGVTKARILLSGDVPSLLNPPPAAASTRVVPKPCPNVRSRSHAGRRSEGGMIRPVISLPEHCFRQRAGATASLLQRGVPLPGNHVARAIKERPMKVRWFM